MSDKRKWTEDQKAAIEKRGSNILLSAAAGSGKTAVLVQRILEIMLDKQKPIDIDKLLIVTYTNAAASEMKQRIGEAIAKELDILLKSDKETMDFKSISHVRRQITLLNKANITTIHSFCLKVVRKHFQMLDGELDPNFRIGDTVELELMKSEIIDELFEEKYEKIINGDNSEDSRQFMYLIESYCNKTDDQNLKDIIYDVANFISSNPWPEKWLNEMAEAFNLDNVEQLENNIWIQNIKEEAKSDINMAITMTQSVLKLAEGNEELNYEDTFIDDINILNKLLEKSYDSFAELYKAFLNFKFSTLKRSKKGADEKLKERCKEVRDKIVKSKIKDLQAKILFRNPEEIVMDFKKLYPIIREIANVTIEFRNKFNVKKQELNVIDFSDLERFSLEILMDKTSNSDNLIPTKVAEDYRNYFEEVLVDEYQDTNLLQDTIVQLVSRGSNLFMVGDVKQSIYKFRLANPELFMDKYNKYKAISEIDSADDNAGNDMSVKLNNLECDELVSQGIRIDLDKNFRSRKEVLEAVNYVFEQVMSERVGEMNYTGKARLNPGLTFEKSEQDLLTAGNVELNIIDYSDNGDQANLEEDLTKIELEAKFTANRIKRLINDDYKVFDSDNKVYRDVKFKDIAILMRTTSTWSSVFLEELLNQGVPVYSDTTAGYFEAIEVKTVISLLKLIDNPIQDIPLLTVLRSPIVGLNANELASIRASFKEETFYNCVADYIENSEDGVEKDKLTAFMDKLYVWREKANEVMIDELLWLLYRETDYYTYAGAMPGGAQRQANLRMLFYYARRFESTDSKGLFSFIRFIEKIQNRLSNDMGAAKLLGENENVVRIMSIHKSKGLEFPVVLVAGMGKQFNMSDLSRPIILHHKLGFGAVYVDVKKRVKYDTISKAAIKYKMRLETLSEEMRILYVAMTRAKEKLILVGTITDVKKQAAKWCSYVDYDEKKLPWFYVKEAKNYLDWVAAAVSRHENGKVIRDAAGHGFIGTNIIAGDMWDVRIITKNELIDIDINDDDKDDKFDDIKDWGNRKCGKNIVERMNWKYPNQRYSKLPTKLSVSEIKNQKSDSLFEKNNVSDEKELIVPKPKFMEEQKKITPAQRGTAIHLLMRHIIEELKNEIKNNGLEYADVDGFIDIMIDREILTEEQKKVIPIKKIVQFFKSGLAERIVNAEIVKCEVPFNLKLDENYIYDKTVENPANILVQGIIDCYFEEKGKIILVDYKTDYVKDISEIDIVKQRYKEQINIYTKAIESILKIKVSEKYLYLFSVDKAVIVD